MRGVSAVVSGQDGDDAGMHAGGVGMTDAINHPAHYGGDTVYEAIKVVEAWGLGFCLGNAVKYICRAGKKAPHDAVKDLATIEDLKKAAWYLNREIERLSSS
jgi:hypothetical protein